MIANIVDCNLDMRKSLTAATGAFTGHFFSPPGKNLSLHHLSCFMGLHTNELPCLSRFHFAHVVKAVPAFD